MRPNVDRDSAAWWERVARHEFAVQRCDRCGTRRWPARAFCPACRAEGWTWEPVEPIGTVVSWIVNHQPFMPGLSTPYVVVMVRLAAVPGALAWGNWHGDGEPRAGQPVEAAYTDAEDGVTLVNWRPRTA
ncbi:zinc ribbon domain-containing protein [Nonomuraea sp. NPDC005983]|uniref:Zn-ribbon domain-containing OB-fold protein n=1 Tax=Nonomuraea sp. NPDC005983 TaxID=3155595 RepID=UPI0033BAD4AB